MNILYHEENIVGRYNLGIDFNGINDIVFRKHKQPTKYTKMKKKIVLLTISLIFPFFASCTGVIVGNNNSVKRDCCPKEKKVEKPKPTKKVCKGKKPQTTVPKPKTDSATKTYSSKKVIPKTTKEKSSCCKEDKFCCNKEKITNSKKIDIKNNTTSKEEIIETKVNEEVENKPLETDRTLETVVIPLGQHY